MTTETFADLPHSQVEAKAIGATRYFTGKPCPKGHIAPRFTANFGCGECLRERSKNYFHENRDHALSVNKQYVHANPEDNARRSRQWYASNRDKALIAILNRKRRVRADGGVIHVWEWRELKERYGSRCLCCGRTEPDVKIVPDHVIPIARGGRNLIENIQPLCERCNKQKMVQSTDYRVTS